MTVTSEWWRERILTHDTSSLLQARPLLGAAAAPVRLRASAQAEARLVFRLSNDSAVRLAVNLTRVGANSTALLSFQLDSAPPAAAARTGDGAAYRAVTVTGISAAAPDGAVAPDTWVFSDEVRTGILA